MIDLKELSERLAWEALESSGNTRRGRRVLREAADALAALGETHVMVPRQHAVEVFHFLNSIEGAGYGGMAAFEIARQDIKTALASPNGGGST